MKRDIFLLFILVSILSFNTDISAQASIQDFNIITPNHTSCIEAGEMLIIKWTNYSYSAKNISRLNIYIVKENNIIYPIAENIINSGGYVTKLPPDFNPGRYKIKITSVDETSFALSEEFRTIAEIPIKIIKPGSNSVWEEDNEYTIKWSAEGNRAYINLLKITKDNKFISRLKIADAIENKGEYLWHIPAGLEEGTYIIAIRIPPIKEIKHSTPFVIKKLRSGDK